MKQVNVRPLKRVTLNVHSVINQVRVVIIEKVVGTFNEDLSRSRTREVVTLLAYRILAEFYYKKRKQTVYEDIVDGTKIDDEIGFPLVT